MAYANGRVTYVLVHLRYIYNYLVHGYALWQLFFPVICVVASVIWSENAFSAVYVSHDRTDGRCSVMASRSIPTLLCRTLFVSLDPRTMAVARAQHHPTDASHTTLGLVNTPTHRLALEKSISDPKAPEPSLSQPERQHLHPSAEPQRQQSRRWSEQAQRPDQKTPACRSFWASIARPCRARSFLQAALTASCPERSIWRVG